MTERDEHLRASAIQRAAEAGQRLALDWGHSPWSDSWAEQVATALFDAAHPVRDGREVTDLLRALLDEAVELVSSEFGPVYGPAFRAELELSLATISEER